MTSIDDYIAQKTGPVQRALRIVREAVRASAPEAREAISYGMPAFEQHGVVLLTFGAFKAHIGFYPGATAIKKFASDLRAYVTAKGSVRFPLDRPMPVDVIQRIARFKLAEANGGAKPRR